MPETLRNQIMVAEGGSPDYLRSSVLHKNQSTTLALVHGLFTHEGYWLPYLKLLRNFRLILVGVAYGHQQFDPKSVSSLLEDICRKESVDVIVGHSLGASLVRVLETKARKALICDVGSARRLQMPRFETITPAFQKISEEEQVRSLKNARELYAAAGSFSKSADLVFTPTVDEYFEYPGKPNFIGTHFEIGNAVSGLAKFLSEGTARSNGI